MKVSRRIITTILFSVLISTVIHLPCVLYAEEAMINETAPEGEPLPIDPEPTDGEVVPKAAASSETTEEPGPGQKVSLPEAMQFTGASAYTYPIEVPPGRAGVAPQIALTYNSQMRNGWLGVGWSLDMGSIQRNTKYGLSYTDQPGDFVASINGSSAELVPRTSDWGAGYWSAKVEGSFSKYYYNTSDPQNKHWIVTAKDGTKYYYGRTTLSRQDFSSGTFKWLLDKVEDVNGNFMTLSYTKDTDYGNNEIYLDRIDYTGNINSPNLTTTSSVIFGLDGTRLDVPDIYTANNLVKTRYRLSSINTYANGQPVRTYTIDYDQSPDINRSLISSITPSSGTSTLPPVSFTYTGTSAAFTVQDWSADLHSKSNTHNRVGDFDGDGKQDIARWVNGTTMTVHFGGNDHFAIPLATWSGQFKQYDDRPMIWVGDFDGDGTSDIATRYNSTTLYINFGDKNRVFNRHASWSAELDSYHNNWVGDFNGDGKTDLMTWDTANPGTKVKVYLSTGTGFSAPVENNVDFNNAALCKVEIWLGDFNGDGMTDVMARDETVSGTQVIMHLATGNGNLSKTTWTGTNMHKGTDHCSLIRLGDFNGDGKTDVMAWDEVGGDDGSQVIVHLSKGNGFALETWYANLKKSLEWGMLFWAADMNGDGMTDIVSRDESDWCIMHHSTGSGFVYEGAGKRWVCKVRIDGLLGPQVLLGDFDGDGRWDLTSKYNDTTAKVHRYPAYTPADVMTTAANGIGGTSTIAYLPSSDRPNPGNLPFVVPTVDRITVNDGNGVSSITVLRLPGRTLCPC